MSEHHIHEISSENEKKIFIVIVVTLLAMIAEVVYGYITNSMALLADGYHMGTHVLALGLTYAAYILIRKFKDSDIFQNGPQKIGTLAAYTSSLFLGLTGIWIIAEGIQRFINPLEIKFDEAILVATIGLIVNAVCIAIMDKKEHKHCNHDNEAEDYNYKSAYYHILADALTSILAIFALAAGKFFDIVYLDSIIGVLGGTLILRWAVGLLKDTIIQLLDMNIKN